MKNLIILCMALFSINMMTAQVYETSYAYDLAGNRISRTTIYLTDKSQEFENAVEIKDIEENFANGKIIVSPNPTERSVFINFTDMSLSDHIKIDVYDINGRLIKSQFAESNRTEVNLMQEQAGTYIIKIHSGNNRKEFIIIKK